jgi:ankyrin repeat protein
MCQWTPRDCQVVGGAGRCVVDGKFSPRNLQPIHGACGNGHLELVKWLAVQHGVSLTAKAKEGSQPIHWACGDGHLELVKWLTE